MQTKLTISTKAKPKTPVVKGNSYAIAEHTAAFLKSGGRIIKIRPGTRDEEANTGKEKIK